MQRSIVLLPDPLRPIITTTLPCSTSSETPLRTFSEPKDLWTDVKRTIDMHSPFNPVAELRKGQTQNEIDGSDHEEGRQWLEGDARNELAGTRDFDEADERGERRSFQDYDHHADGRRQGDTERLRQDDV